VHHRPNTGRPFLRGYSGQRSKPASVAGVLGMLLRCLALVLRRCS
jgi:hypothetical protein